MALPPTAVALPSLKPGTDWLVRSTELMQAKQLADTLVPLLDEMRKDIKRDVQEFVEGAIEAHRRRMWVREKWCCPEMIEFARVVWLAPNPPRRDETTFGGVRLELRGRTVNYCPFCGVGV
jgi:hypothetical protein